MTTATQVKIRRNTQTGCDAFTPADGELVVDQTNRHLRVGDGVTLGGFVQASKAYVDTQIAGFSANAASNLLLWATCT